MCGGVLAELVFDRRLVGLPSSEFSPLLHRAPFLGNCSAKMEGRFRPPDLNEKPTCRDVVLIFGIEAIVVLGDGKVEDSVRNPF